MWLGLTLLASLQNVTLTRKWKHDCTIDRDIFLTECRNWYLCTEILVRFISHLRGNLRFIFFILLLRFIYLYFSVIFFTNFLLCSCYCFTSNFFNILYFLRFIMGCFMDRWTQCFHEICRLKSKLVSETLRGWCVFRPSQVE